MNRERHVLFEHSIDLTGAEATTLVATAAETHRTNRTAEYEVRVTAEDERVATFRGRVYRL
nr:hypothetical protein [Halocatena marina]